VDRGEGAADFEAEKVGQRRIISRISGMVARFAGLNSNILRRITSSSSEIGRMDLRNLGSFMNARKVLSSKEARFQGLRPQVRLTSMTPKLHTSLGADA
jgi:hypothetical protein